MTGFDDPTEPSESPQRGDSAGGGNPIDRLVDAVIARIRAGDDAAWSDQAVLRLATAVARAQHRYNPDVLPEPPASVETLAMLPCVTTDAFRFSRVAALPPDLEPVAVYLTSGTTAHYRGRHSLYRTDIYEASALAAFDRLVLARRPLERLIALVPEARAAPHSSLSAMVDQFARLRFAGRTDYAVAPGGLDTSRLERAFARAMEDGGRTLLFTTTLAAVALLERDAGGRLPDGSLILTTGGPKGLGTAADPKAVEERLAARFPGAAVGAEFGMTELLSQGYRLSGEAFELPPWCRVLAIDPATGRPCRPGHVGLLRFVDLANVQSAVVVQTADLGVALARGGAFEYRGRAAGAVVRGCSLTFEELDSRHHEPEQPT